MTYCLSDVHGEYQRFLTMLEMISFSDEDDLFILGDVIDRYDGGIQLLQHIMRTPNMHMLLGNHEDMMVDAMKYRSRGAKNLWFDNGGSITHNELLDLDESERETIIEWVDHLPLEFAVTVGEQKYYLVHGWPGLSREEKIWGRPNNGITVNCNPDVIPIIGHTPTPCLRTYKHYDSKFQIANAGRCIDIDCGCGHSNEMRQLACLRLDDMQEFYV